MVNWGYVQVGLSNCFGELHGFLPSSTLLIRGFLLVRLALPTYSVLDHAWAKCQGFII